MVTNRRAGDQFRNEVLLYLHQQCLVDARRPASSNRLSDLVGGEAAKTDVAGLEPWVIDVRTAQTIDLSGALDHAKRCASWAGSDWYVSIQSRRTREVDEAYCVLPLNIMARLFRGEVPNVRSLPLA